MDEQFEKAVTAVRTKNNSEARQLLARIIQNDPRNVRAWLLLSYVVEQKERQIECLHRVLNISSNHSLAKERLFQLETAVKAKPIQRITRIQSFNPIPRSELSAYRLELLKDAEDADLQTLPEAEVQAELEPFPDIVKLLFEDIARLPIVANLAQDLWLGIQLKAARHWNIFIRENFFGDVDNEIACLSVCTTLVDKHQYLKTLCLEHDIKIPKIEIWIDELLSTRRNIYQLKQSRLRRFMRRAEQQTDKDIGQRFLETAGSVVEVLCWLPNDFLIQIIDFIHEYEHLPTSERMSKWLVTITSVQQLKCRIKKQDNITKQILVTGYFRYSLRVAQGYIGKGVDYADLAQESFLGLMRASETFDYYEQIRFGAYATTWAWQKVTRSIGIQANTIRIPVHRQEDLQKFKQACEEFDTGQEPYVINFAVLFHAGLLDRADFDQLERTKKMGKYPEKAVQERYEEAIRKAEIFDLLQMQSVSLNDLFPKSDRLMERDTFGDNDPVLETIPDVSIALPETATDKIIVHDIINEDILTLLEPRERQVLRLRYGLEDGQERTLKEVGELFGLSRERIRQLEKESLIRLENLSTWGKITNLYDLLPDADAFSNINAQLPNCSTDMNFALSDENAEEHLWLDTQLANLPRNSRKGSHKGKYGSTRKEQLSSALYSLSALSHFSDITEQFNGESTEKPLESLYIYSLLAQYEDLFILLGEGVFSFVAWERKRANQDIPILPYCPISLPDPPDYENAFLESILIGKEQLRKDITVKQFLYNMLQWAKVDADPQKWLLQSILSAYYLVGLLPYTFYLDDNNTVLTCTLPDLDIQELRLYCLRTLTERLVAMPEFWWLLQKEQPARPSTLGDEFADIHPDGLDDVLHRLRMLTGLGAVQKLKYGSYRLTPIGAKCAYMWGKQPKLTIDTLSETSNEDHLMDFAIWQ